MQMSLFFCWGKLFSVFIDFIIVLDCITNTGYMLCKVHSHSFYTCIKALAPDDALIIGPVHSCYQTMEISSSSNPVFIFLNVDLSLNLSDSMHVSNRDLILIPEFEYLPKHCTMSTDLIMAFY